MADIDIDLIISGPEDHEHEIRIVGSYSPSRPTPAIDRKRYDATKCDPGDPEDAEMERVYLIHGQRMRLLDNAVGESILESDDILSMFADKAREKWDEA